MLSIHLLTWIHVLCLVGAFGAIAVVRYALPPAARDSVEGSAGADRFAVYLLALGFLAGLFLFVILMRNGYLDRRDHALIGTKFLLLLVAGGMLGAGSGKLKKGQAGTANTLRTVALLALAAAALLGLLI